MRALLLATLILWLFCNHAWAWGDTAHQVICEVAFRLAQPATQAEVQRLINSDPAATFPDFSESCVFPDHPRILASKNETDANRLLALESLGHWVGDIHQPLHVAFEDDRGGNKISVSGCARNLHTVWDNCLVDYAVGDDVVKAATNMMAAMTPGMLIQWTSSNPRDWANETFAVAKAVTTRYCVMHGQSCDPLGEHLTITTEYLELNKPVIREQLQKAAVRLAHLLDTALGN